MHLDAARLSEALVAIYAVAEDGRNAAPLPEALARAFDANSCLLHTRGEAPDGVTVVGATANCASIAEGYAAEYAVQDRWHVGGARRLDKALIGEEVWPEADLVNTELYRDVMRPHEVHHLVGAVFSIAPGLTGSIGVHRAAGRDPFCPSDRGFCDLLLPHLRQAFRLRRYAEQLGDAQRLCFEALAALSIGVFVVSGDARAIMVNAAAEALVRRGVTRIRNGRLALGGGADRRLQAAVRAASLAPLGLSLLAEDTIVAHDPAGAELTILVCPLPRATSGRDEGQPLAAVFVADSSVPFEPPASILSAAYGLTAAEARVVASLLKGLTPAEHAKAMDVSPLTVKTQLRAIYAKTRTRRQAEVVRRFAADPLLRMSASLHVPARQEPDSCAGRRGASAAATAGKPGR